MLRILESVLQFQERYSRFHHNGTPIVKETFVILPDAAFSRLEILIQTKKQLKFHKINIKISCFESAILN